MVKCIAMSQQIDAAAGADPYVCFKAVEEAKQLERDDKAMSFRRIHTQLKRARRSTASTASMAHHRQHGLSSFPGVGGEEAVDVTTARAGRRISSRSWQVSTPGIPPPRNLIPTSWAAGPKFEATRRRHAEAARDGEI